MEYKFRAYNKRLKQMYEVYRIDFDHGLVFCRDAEKNTTHTFGMIDVVLMMYTGLKDKNRREIYAGDILSSPHFKDAAGRQHILKHIVQWSDEYLGWWLQHPRAKDKHDGCLQMFVAAKNTEFTIIGNIDETPELLEE